MKKRTVALCGVAAVAGIALASCGGKKVTKIEGDSVSVKSTYNYEKITDKNNTAYTENAGTVDIYLSYKGDAGVSVRAKYTDPTFGETGKTEMTPGIAKDASSLNAMTPTWARIAELTNSTILDSCDYAKEDPSVRYPKLKTNEWKSVNGNGRVVDLFGGGTSDITANTGDFVDLTTYINNGSMPNFKKYLEENPAVKEQIEYNGGIYYTPYFDSYNDIEHYFIMDTEIVKKVLDVENFDNFDTTVSGKGAAANTLQENKFTGFINKEFNYPDKKTTVKISVNGKAEEREIKQVKNIITRQNELLAAGTTGKELAKQFADYIDEVYGDFYTNRSQAFISEAAIYNTDDLIALMRVVKANPGVVTGDVNAEVETLFPRGMKDSRVDNVLQACSQMFGVLGSASELGGSRLYFDADGLLHDGMTTRASYDVLALMSQLYDEGLIVKDLYYYDKTNKSDNEYLDRFFKKNAGTYGDPGYGLLMYDYSLTQVIANDMVNGMGTLPSSRTINAGKAEADFVKVTGIMPILPPLTYWPDKKGYDHTAVLGSEADRNQKSLLRYSDDNRALKTDCWAIPAASDNIDGAVRIMDYIFSPYGAMIQDYGPERYWERPNLDNGDTIVGATAVEADANYVTGDILAGTKCPVLGMPVKQMLSAQTKDFWTFCRSTFGPTNCCGHVRSSALQIQGCNFYGQIGASNMAKAMADGVVYYNTVVEKGKQSWCNSVPTAGYPKIDDSVANLYSNISTFWDYKKVATEPLSWMKYVCGGAQASFSFDDDTTSYGKDKANNTITLKGIFDTFDYKNKNYLRPNAANNALIGETFVPDYAKATA